MRGLALIISAVASTLTASAAAEAGEWSRSQRATLAQPGSAADVAGGRVAESVLVAQGVASPSPCEDEMYQKLKSKDVGQMTPREYETFLRKEDACTSSRPPPAKEVGPCEDAFYLGLKSKDLNRMSAREYETFKQKDGLCNDHQRARFSGVVPSATPVPKHVRGTPGEASPPLPLASDPDLFDSPDESRKTWEPGSRQSSGATRKPVAGAIHAAVGMNGFGLTTSFRQAAWPVEISLDVFHTADDFAIVKTEVNEFATGVRFGLFQRTGQLGVEKTFTYAFRTDLAAGLSLASGHESSKDIFEGTSETDSWSSAGVWFGGGEFLRFKRADLGIAYRYSSASLRRYSVGANGVWIFAGVRFGGAAREQ